MRVKLFFSYTLTLVVLSCSSPVELTSDYVSRVIDGDTVDVSDGSIRVRLLGIDSPETRHPQKGVECGGPESTEWAKQQLPVGSQVRVVFDETQDSKDRYDRSLAYIEYKINDSWFDFSVESARSGMSRSYVYDNNPVQKYDQIVAAEAEAKEARRGLWSC